MLALRNWPWFVLSVLIMFAIFGVYLHYQPLVYKVRATLLLKNKVQKNEATNISSIFGGSQINTTNIKSIEDEIGILTSYTLMDRVVKRLGLDIHYYRSVDGIQREIYANSPIRLEVEKGESTLYTNDLIVSFSASNKVLINNRIYPTNQFVNTEYGRLRIIPQRVLSDTVQPITVSFSSRPRIVNAYLARLEVVPVLKQSGLLTISLIEAVPDKGEAILKQLINEYIKEDITYRKQEVSNLLSLIEDRLELIAARKHNDEIPLNNSFDKPEDVLLSEQEVNAQLLDEIEKKLNGLKLIERYAQNKGGKARLDQVALTLSDPVLINQLEEALHLETKQNKGNHGTIQDSALYQQLKYIKYRIYKSLQRIRKQLTQSRNEIIGQNRRTREGIKVKPTKETALVSVLNQPAIRNTLYSYLLQKREEAVMSVLSTTSESRIIDMPRTEVVSSATVNVMVFILLGCSGLVLPILFIGVKNAFNNRITQRTEVEELTHVPILGEISLSQQITVDNLVFRPRIQSVMGEQIRALRTNLQFAGNEPHRNKVILFTSCLSGEGKSLISINLGASLALLGRKTIVLEMDMRRPRLHKGLHLEKRNGVSHYLIGESTVDEIIQPIAGYNNYFIATAGLLPLNPAELLGSERLPKLLHELNKEFDHIVIDSPPIGLVTDSQLIAPFVDITLFVVRHNYTPKHCMKMVNNLHNGNRFPNLNIVLNAVGEGDIRYSNYYDGDYTLSPA
ncbi:polysaccharide biosynthesis tyrosine autokinase [Larkinella sp. VNQ87]|uniref:polysaccharide biosynthesis tyrosine autokinase n=1 Tax=Larkinella sp. VNQ87 TaxID=3400921 RepID=UPI003C02583B